jgi:penicillin-binding protein 2A
LIQSGGIFINPSTGGISALVGGRGDHAFRGFNHATQLIRQPGSTMKPLAVYTPALERGYDPFDRLEDQPLNLDGYQPYNYDKQFRGQVTMYEALIHSYNVPAVWLLNKIGLQEGIEAIERFGIPLQEEDHSLSLALGGMSKGTSPLKMAQAYSTFANDGVMVEAHAIQRIEDANGEKLGEWQNKSTKVTESEVAQKITYMLKGVVEGGTGKKARVDGLEVAGKTGSTQLPFENEEGAKDHWFVGYTPELVGAVWLGYDQTDQDHYLPSSSSATAPILFKEILSKSASEIPNKAFNIAPIEKKYKQEEQKRKEVEEEEEIRKEEAKKKEEIKKEEEIKKVEENAKKAEEKEKKAEKAINKEEKEKQKEEKKQEKEKKKEEKD